MANERRGIQPVVTVKANGRKRADSKVGQTVTFTAEIEVPKNKGKIVSADWNFEGLPENSSKLTDAFPVTATLIPTDKTGTHVTVKTTYTFTKPGTYFPTLRV